MSDTLPSQRYGVDDRSLERAQRLLVGMSEVAEDELDEVPAWIYAALWAVRQAREEANGA